MTSTDPTVLITGTNRGTGRAIAEVMHTAGWRIVSLNRTLSGEPWLGEITCDLSLPDQITAAMAEAAATVERIDACVLNAAVRKLGPLASLPAEDMNNSIAINLLAPFLLTQATLPLLRSSRGIYVFIGSHAGSRFFEGGTAYCASKSALKALVEILLLEERAAGVRAVLVSPGAIANRDYDCSPLKMSPESVGRCVAQLITQTPPDIVVGEIEIRPANLAPAVVGLERLQHV